MSTLCILLGVFIACCNLVFSSDEACAINLSILKEMKFMREEMTSMRDRIEKLEAQNIQLKADSERLSQMSSKRLLLPDSDNSKQTVAFSAYLSHSFEGTTFGTLREIIYDKTEINNGQAYDKFSGTFRAPVAGVYAFTWTIFVDQKADAKGSRGEIVTELVVNGVVHGVIHADTEVASDDDSATGFVIKELAVGDTVFVRTNKDFVPQGYLMSNGKNGVRWTFSGWMIS